MMSLIASLKRRELLNGGVLNLRAYCAVLPTMIIISPSPYSVI